MTRSLELRPRQRIRRTLLLVSLLAFPVTLYYFSPALIIMAGIQGVINGSFVVFAAMFVLSPLLGRLFCGYLCPAGGLQDCVATITTARPRQGRRNYIKYGIWGVWITAVVLVYALIDGHPRLDVLYETEHGVSVMAPQSYIVYYGIVLLIVVPSLIGGRRTFCHYLCWMAPFMVLGTKLGRRLRVPGVRILATPDRCRACATCNSACPMGIDVRAAVQTGGIFDAECIQCGSCVDVCPAQVLSYRMKGGTAGGQRTQTGLRDPRLVKP